jgi:hypothetical protein
MMKEVKLDTRNIEKLAELLRLFSFEQGLNDAGSRNTEYENASDNRAYLRNPIWWTGMIISAFLSQSLPCTEFASDFGCESAVVQWLLEKVRATMYAMSSVSERLIMNVCT